MVLNSAPSTNPGSAHAEPGLTRIPRFSLALRVACLSLIAGLLGMGIHVFMQLSRISLFDAIQRDLRASASSSELDAAVISDHASWAIQCSHALAREGAGPFQALADAKATFENRADTWLFAILLGTCSALTAVVLASASLAGFVGQSRHVPYELTVRERLLAGLEAIWSAKYWCWLAATIAGFLAWYVAFDRSGTGPSLLAGLLPTPRQWAGATAVFGVLTFASGMVFFVHQFQGLKTEATLANRVCAKCRYSTSGLPGTTCPECGLAVDEPSGLRRSPHLTLSKFTGWCVVVVGILMLSAGLISSESQLWMHLKDPHPNWQNVAKVLGGDAPTVLRASFGEVTFSAHQDRAASGNWTVRWAFAPSSRGQSSSGEFLVPDVESSTGNFEPVIKALPFGAVRLWRPAGDARLVIDTQYGVFR